jgi:hypothetical protein
MSKTSGVRGQVIGDRPRCSQPQIRLLGWGLLSGEVGLLLGLLGGEAGVDDD